jgi:hypothetical protein
MTEKYFSPWRAFVGMTRDLVMGKKLTPYYISYNTKHLNLGDSITKAKEIFPDSKDMYKGDQLMSWPEWLIEGVFPYHLYLEHKESLTDMLKDERLFQPPSFFKKDSHTSFVGRMARPRKGKSFLAYAIDRWSRGNHKSMPHFYFDVESPEWVFEELMRNQDQIKSGRTAVSCVMNISLRWDSVKKEPWLFLIIKHSQWSHCFGDIFGGALFLNAFLKEVNLPLNGNVGIFFVSVTFDGKKNVLV